MASLKFSSLLLFVTLCTLFQHSSQNFLTDAFYHVIDHVEDYFGPNISTDPNDVGFYLYPNPDDLLDNDKLVYGDKASLYNARFKPNSPYVFLIHGFMQNYTAEFPQNVKNAYLENGYGPDLNVIAVAWGKLTHDYSDTSGVQSLLFLPGYQVSVENVKVVGKRVAELIEELMQEGLLVGGGDKVHIIGFSLGAHAAANAGLNFEQSTGKKLNRITGLDPAGPGFQQKGPEDRLDPTDAEFVDVLHTNSVELGFCGPLGQIDFFANGGAGQPRCVFNDPNASFAGNAKARSVCSHDLAPVYYAKSIGDKTMKGCPSDALTRFNCDIVERSGCDQSQKVVFGESCPPGSKGSYYLTISADQE